jgi:hypothetical protein
MILKATAHVGAGRYQSPFRQILADEFQDISRSRSRPKLASPQTRVACNAAPETFSARPQADTESVVVFGGWVTLGEAPKRLAVQMPGCVPALRSSCVYEFLWLCWPALTCCSCVPP